MTVPAPDGDVLARLHTAVETALPVVAGTSDDDDRPTPCAEWTVRDLVGHMTATLGMFQDDAEPTRNSFLDVAQAVLEAWSDPDRLTGTVTLPFGEVPATFALEFPVLDTLVHTWDLGQATDREIVWDDEVVAASRRFAESTFAGPESRGPAFAPPVDPPPGADEITRLVRFLGRSD